MLDGMGKIIRNAQCAMRNFVRGQASVYNLFDI